MESKRKSIATTISPDNSDRALKRRKLPLPDLTKGETPETTAQYGMAFFDLVREARDKRGRTVIHAFLELPDKNLYPDYYNAIALPLSINMIEDGLAHGEYPNMTRLESDMKRLVANAKSYNERGSELFSDAERIRKILCDFMKKNNPAYNDPDYVSFPTPLPTRDGVNIAGDEENTSVRSRQPSTPLATPTALTSPGRTRRSATKPTGPDHSSTDGTPAAPAEASERKDAHVEGNRFEGMDFQQIQEEILREILELHDDNDQKVSEPFLNLPARTLRDYYNLIKRPVSLKQIHKRVRGIVGRNDATRVSVYKTWRSFEEECNLIWRNAREYNEDNSVIAHLAGQLEEHFNKLVSEAKKIVPEHHGGDGTQRLKLKMSALKSPDAPPQKIMLRVGGHKAASPAVAQASDANGEQYPSHGGEDTRNGQRRKSVAEARTSSEDMHTTRNGSQDEAVRSSQSAGSPVHASDVKTEVTAKSPGLGAIRAASSGLAERPGSSGAAAHAATATTPMGPPSRPASGSPHPLQTNGHSISHQPIITPPAPPIHFDSKYRPAGTGNEPHTEVSLIRQTDEILDASNALITRLLITTHPGLKLDRPYKLEIPASDTLLQQSFTINLPMTHHSLQIMPTIAGTVIIRQYRVFVTVNTQRLGPVHQIQQQADPRRPTYEARLGQGVNRVEVEILAGPIRGTPKTGTGPEIEVEKFTLFFNLSKARFDV
ncbi:MAG: hypothetical protein M1825_000680 [Sarcosagium campestre]|nr:MAG: hypothetical protein M1825_000680 [Sarcosagium campestre]